MKPLDTRLVKNYNRNIQIYQIFKTATPPSSLCSVTTAAAARLPPALSSWIVLCQEILGKQKVQQWREKEKNADLMLQISNRARLQITTDRTVWGKHRNKSRRFKSKPCSRSPSWSHIMTLSTSANFLPCSIFGATSQFNWRKWKPNTFSTVSWTCSCVTDVKKYFLSASVCFDTMVSPQSWQPMTLDQLQGLLTGCQLLPVQLSVYTEHISVVQWKQWLILPEHHTATVKVMFAESLVGSLWKGRVQRDERRLWMKYMYKMGKVSHWIRRQDNPDRYMHYLLGDFSVMETKKDNWWVKKKNEKWIQQKTVPPLNKPALDWRNSCHFSKRHCQ